MTDTNPRPIIGLLSERHDGERRAAIVPADIKRMANRVTFIVERGAGTKSGYSDQAYMEAGAAIVDRTDLKSSSDILLGVRAPIDLSDLPKGKILISLGGRDIDVLDAVLERDIKHLGLERLPRTTRAQAMDVLSSQATVAGYAAVIEGARELDVFLPMLTTAAGSVKPAKMIALGAGVAGLQAIATARRLGAMVHGFDVREAAREQIESLGARFVSLGDALKSQDVANGYAGEQSADQQARLRQALASTLAQMQLIVTSAQIPGRTAPLLIDDAALSSLTPGTVIVDLAAETGGNTSRTKPGETIRFNGVTIIGSVNLPSQMAADASRLFSGNIRALLEYLIPDETGVLLQSEDPIVGPLLGVDAVLRTAA
ncbi:NAD(P) transhydrogenase subunit alpha [Rhizobium sp. P32RR-XVIII]|uniref:NAD(P) transhydrogenase subunit alpha n=1 Tax=Rhizobium sp. P32RR-XVIII TaxID=2726738 RepID=UPI0014579063|nr:NAD(P) transhydrogenase subunit alpha [Rhizobium sp. P32RR-XVIII]NLS06006.1 NAD(P) transhydrogenase subunit alpha [Rhizobium sp. P32RR-XVIII]